MERNKMLKKKKIQLILFMTIFLFAPVIVFSAPSITGVSGTFTNGSVITITGSGFGTKTPAPLISSYDNSVTSDNFHSGNISSSWHTQGNPVLSTTSPRTTFPQSSHKISYNAAGPYDVIGYNYSARSDRVYISWWTYNDYAAFLGSGADGNAKWIRVYSSSGDGNGLVLSNLWDGSAHFYNTYGVPEYAPSCSGWTLAYSGTGATSGASSFFRVNFGSADQDNTMQEWVHWEMYNMYSPSLEAGNDTAILLKNGRTVYRATGVSLQKSDSNDDQRNLRLGQVSGGRGEAQMEYIDQIYYDTSFAHVFLADSNTYSFPDSGSATHTEIQVPSSWADGQIQITLNQGTFPGNANVHLYVMDAAGDITSTPIALGSSSSSGWERTPTNVNNTTYFQNLHAMRNHDSVVRVGSNIFVLAPYHSGGRVAIWRSTDEGNTWTAMTQSGTSTDYISSIDASPLIRDSAGNVYHFGRYNGYLRMVKFNGATAAQFPAPVNMVAIGNYSHGGYASMSATIDSQDRLFVTASEVATSNHDNFRMTISSNGGASWSALQTIFPADGDDSRYTGNCAVSEDDDITCVSGSYQENPREIQISYSSDHGASWSTPNTIYSGVMANPHILAKGNNELFVFAQSEDDPTPGRGLVMNHSTDSGTTWSGWSLKEGTCNYFDPTAAIDTNGNIYVAGRRDNGLGTVGTGCGDSSYSTVMVSTDNGTTFSPVIWTNNMERAGSMTKLRYQTWGTGGGRLEWSWMNYDNGGTTTPTFYNQNSQVTIYTPSSQPVQTTFYIDQSATDDSGTGTKADPWKRCPGMVGWSGNHTVQPGDTFVFKGGETWGAAELPLTIGASGASGNPVAYTIDQTWYTGGSYSRPVFNGGNTDANIIDLNTRSYISIDGLEIINATAYGIVNDSSEFQSHYAIDNLLMHGIGNRAINLVRVDDSSITNNTFHDNTNYDIWLSGKVPHFRSNCVSNPPGSDTCISCNDDYALTTEPAEEDWADNIVISGNTITNGRIKPNTIRNSNIFNNTINNTTSFKSAFGHTSYWWDNVHFHDNTMTMQTNDENCIALEVWHIQNNCILENNITNGWWSLTRNVHGGHSPYQMQIKNNTFDSDVEVGLAGGGKTSAYAIEINKYSFDVLVDGNTFTGVDSMDHGYRHGISTSAGPVNNVTISNNTFTNLPRKALFLSLTNQQYKVSDFDNFDIHDNVYNFTTNSGRSAVYINDHTAEGDADNINFHDNTMHHGVGVVIADWNSVSNVDIVDNHLCDGATTHSGAGGFDQITGNDAVCGSEIRADVDQNGSINSTDAMLTLRNSLGLSMAGTDWEASATTGDANCDGNSNSTDAMLILRHSLGLSDGVGWCEN